VKAAQPSLDDAAREAVRQRRDARIIERLETLSNLVADLEARLPGWRREVDGLLAELRGR
jgi:hypothetical protein